MGWNSQNITSLQIIVAGQGFTGQFVYSPSEGAGNLISSTAASSGTDPYGNAYLAGTTSYHQVAAGQWIAIQQSGGQITFSIATTEAGPWTAQSTIASDFTNDLNITATATLGLASSLGASISISSTANGISTVGDFIVGNGNAGYATDPSIGGREFWHTPTLTGFAAVAGNQPVKYRLAFDGDVQITGIMQATGAYGGGATIWTQPAAYRPSTNTAEVAVTRNVANAFTTIVANIQTTGVVSIPIALNLNDIIEFGGGSYRLVA